jgi:AcrR family transcriptional regulator
LRCSPREACGATGSPVCGDKKIKPTVHPKASASRSRGASPRRSGRRTQDERTRATTARIMAAARSCLLEVGYAGTTMAAIAAKAGVTRGALQHHYGSRKDVLSAVIESFFAALPQLEETKAGKDPVQDVVAFISESFRAYGSEMAVAVLILRLGAQHEPELKELLEGKFAVLDPFRDEVWSRLFKRAGLSTGEANTLRELMYAVLRGLAVRQAYVRQPYSAAGEVAAVTEMVSLYLARHTRAKHQ